ncbi:MAG: beta-ketoacyl-ACP synthase II [Elusimicrobia bacterium]|nr:beta-ketoacyl-ACP synthase II [Elusimicrobiota bacterium]MBD3412106.1 beta-ketoacyl-ACP synthase II [Elusimicrobiota bacterium]
MSLQTKRRVVITGLGVISPIGIGKEAFRTAVLNGKSGASRITAFDASSNSSQIAAEVHDFKPDEFLEKKKIRRMDRFAQFALASAIMAIQDSGLDFARERSNRIGVIVGSGIGGLGTIESEHRVLIERGPRKISPFLIPMLITNMASGEIAIHFGLTGINYSVSSACATSNHALGDALRLIRYGDADIIVSGGTEAAITPLGFSGFCSIKALSTRNDDPLKASRPFDKNRDGFVMAEGCGIIVLEELEHAKARGAHIYAELCGYGATDDAYHITAPNPQTTAVETAMARAIEDGAISRDEINYINAHGTSTLYNDKVETAAIKKFFGDRAKTIPISSTKSMTGHCLGAAGSIELIATLLGMEQDLIHPTINYETPDPECDLDYVPNTSRKHRISAAISNSLGFGGHNAVIAFRRYE